jgi:hypothetical protein
MRITFFVIPGLSEAENPEPRGDRLSVCPWVPDRASRVRNDENLSTGQTG